MRTKFMTRLGGASAAKRAFKSETIQLRLSAEDAAVLDIASRTLGVSKSALLREHGVAAARALIEEERALRWSPEAFDALIAHLKEAARPDEGMAGLLGRKRIWDDA
jgi:uncharacterized protein (DUF1778 family)